MALDTIQAIPMGSTNTINQATNLNTEAFNVNPTQVAVNLPSLPSPESIMRNFGADRLLEIFKRNGLDLATKSVKQLQNSLESMSPEALQGLVDDLGINVNLETLSPIFLFPIIWILSILLHLLGEELKRP